MDLVAAARSSGFIQEKHVHALLSQLKLPHFGWIIADPSNREERLQGDVFKDMPIGLIGPDGNCKKTTVTAMVVNNACDLQEERSDFVTVVPLQSFSSFSNFQDPAFDTEQRKSFLNSVVNNRVTEIIYLPACPQLSEASVILLDRMSTLSIEVYEDALDRGNRVASLTQNGFYLLLMRIGNFLLRPESSDISR
jgi:hypothetical protein